MIVRPCVYFSLAALVAATWGMSAVSVQAGVIAHWSFDSTVAGTTGNGDVYIDSTGNHNATIVVNGTGASISSTAGQFGQAALFDNVNANGQAQAVNNASMSFPQLTEIAGAAAGDFTVASWVNVADQASWDDNPILIDWGNAPAGTHRFTYWFQLDNVDSNAGLRPRAQIRAANAPPDPVNIDIIATTLSAAQAGTGGGPTNFDDGVWHHLAWTWTKSTGEMTFYTDGVLRHTQTSTQPLANRDLLVSDSPVGALGAKRDNNRFFRGAMDEVWVVDRALSDAEVAGLRATNLVPEPASAVIAVFGLAALGTMLRRRI